jgi:hypothetical protein
LGTAFILTLGDKEPFDNPPPVVNVKDFIIPPPYMNGDGFMTSAAVFL